MGESLGQLQSLKVKELDLKECESLSFLPESLGQLQSLEVLNKPASQSLSSLPERLRQLQSWKTIDLHNPRPSSMDRKYQRIRLIAKKGSGCKTYLLKDSEEHRLVVLKTIELGRVDATSVKEACLLKKMKHPNITSFYDVFKTKKGRLCICMEYVDGGSVHSEIEKQEGKLIQEPHLLSWFVQTCFALVHLHEQKVLHRNLKPWKILLMTTGQIKLGDLGVSIVLDFTKDGANTRDEQGAQGVPWYFSPEFFSAKPYSFPTDVWSCGCILFEMCTLHHLFDGDCLDVAKKLRYYDNIIPTIDKMYAPEIYDLIQRMCHKVDKQRPSFKEILRAAILQVPMSKANDDFKLGLDLSEFVPAAKR